MLHEVTRSTETSGRYPQSTSWGYASLSRGLPALPGAVRAHSAAPKDTCAACVALTDGTQECCMISARPSLGYRKRPHRHGPQLCQTLLCASPIQAKWLEQSPGHPGR